MFEFDETKGRDETSVYIACVKRKKGGKGAKSKNGVWKSGIKEMEFENGENLGEMQKEEFVFGV